MTMIIGDPIKYKFFPNNIYLQLDVVIGPTVGVGSGKRRLKNTNQKYNKY